MKINLTMQFPDGEVRNWSARYLEDLKKRPNEAPLESEVVEEIAPRVLKDRCLTKPDFITICKWKAIRWKTKRLKDYWESNAEQFVKEVTRVAFSTPDEQLRIEVLTLLKGVEWPVASAILHFGHEDDYPILDFRALWSLGIKKRLDKYDFSFWRAYTEFCRDKARQCGVSMRNLDRALWQYSRENQGR